MIPGQLDLWDDPEELEAEEDAEERAEYERSIRHARGRHFAEGGSWESWDDLVERSL